jgi:D-alanine-D-alanine ligase
VATGKKVIILHEGFTDTLSADEKDTLFQVEIIHEALKKLGMEPIILPVTLDLSDTIDRLKKIKPFIVFNLVESLDGKTRYIHFIPTLLEECNFAFTGSGGDALFLSSNKILSKQLMLRSGIETPDWQTAEEIRKAGIMLPTPFIIKPIAEDASKLIDDRSVCLTEEHYFDAQHTVTDIHPDTFIEAFIEGREINVSFLSSNGLPEILPPSEIQFKEFPENKPRIVNYDAKWSEHTFEYHHTPRTFAFSARDRHLLGQLKKIACKCWDCFRLRGYARIDFRIDKHNKPWVIDINANPCLSPDSGFVAAATTAGYTYEGIITRIIDEAYFYCGRKQKRAA